MASKTKQVSSLASLSRERQLYIKPGTNPSEQRGVRRPKSWYNLGRESGRLLLLLADDEDDKIDLYNFIYLCIRIAAVYHFILFSHVFINLDIPTISFNFIT